MAKSTFINLNDKKKDNVVKVLIDVFYNKHVSQVTVSEIVKELGMSRGAFYKYFDDIHDAYHTICKIGSAEIHGAIMTFIQENTDQFFVGIEKYLSWCAGLNKDSYEWKIIQLITLSNATILSKRQDITEEVFESKMTKSWLKILQTSGFDFNSSEEALYFLYFIMNNVITSLQDFIVNSWSKEELLKDFSYKKQWIINGIKK